MKEILNNSEFDIVFDYIYNEVSEEYNVVPNVPRIYEILKNYNVEIIEKSSKWIVVKCRDWAFSDDCESEGLWPMTGMREYYENFL